MKETLDFTWDVGDKVELGKNMFFQITSLEASKCCGGWQLFYGGRTISTLGTFSYSNQVGMLTQDVKVAQSTLTEASNLYKQLKKEEEEKCLKNKKPE